MGAAKWAGGGGAVGCRLAELLCLVALMLLVAPAEAARLPAQQVGRAELEAPGMQLRPARSLRWSTRPPARVEAAGQRGWSALRAELGPSSWAAWDELTGVPTLIVGPGVSAPGSVASADVAERHARSFLSRHLALLAPGAAEGDLLLASNLLSDGTRSLGFSQHADGVPVLGGQLALRYQADRLVMVSSTALPWAWAELPSDPISPLEASDSARAWVLSDLATSAQVRALDGPWVLPLLGSKGVALRTVLRVIVQAEAPRGRYGVYLDLASGQPLARRQLLRFASGWLLYDAPQRWPGGQRQAYPASQAQVEVDGAAQISAADGTLLWPGAGPAEVLPTTSGPEVLVSNVAGPAASTTLSLEDDEVALWSAAANEQVDAQLSAFVHAGRGLAYARGLDPSLPFLFQPLQVNVNLNLECNAFYDGAAINFFLSSPDCSNTARLADIVFHEIGHALHDHAIIAGVGSFDSALSEGLSDYFAATITGDPAMGVGFYKSSQPLRHLDPQHSEALWPDHIGGPHGTGRIISGALWDLRKLLIADHGADDGVALADRLFYQALRRSVDIPSSYFEVLVADDDDGDLDNGTPNVCAIDSAFGAHGLRKLVADLQVPTVTPPGLAQHTVTLTIAGLHPQCAADGEVSATLQWRRREQPLVGGSLDFEPLEGAWLALIPAQADGTVVQYRIEISLGDGSTVPLPSNPADPWYEMFVGHVEPIYCTDFEADPFLEGWTHGGAAAVDEWSWGVPVSLAGSGDPAAAYSGQRLLGTDLGGPGDDGKYGQGADIHAQSPLVDVGDHQLVRLQYRRWLEVEDGFYDQATIHAGGQALWSNLNSDAGTKSAVHHRDHEWRFHDVDLSAAVADGQIDVRFALASDQGLELGGWSLDDFCIVGWVPTVCGDGLMTGLEPCDDGEANSDVLADACRSDCTLPGCGDGVRDAGESCDDGNVLAGDGCEADCTATPEPPPPPEEPAPPAAAARGDDGRGCSCRLGAEPRDSGWAFFVLAAGLAASRRRRP